MSTKENFILNIVDSQIVNFTVFDVRILANNAIGSTTLFFGDIEVTEG